MSLANDLEAAFPWMRELGLSVKWVQNTLAVSQSPAETVAKIRATSQWKRRFAGILKDDGTMRMSEAEFVRTERDYRNILRQFGFNVERDYGTPAALRGWIENDVAPDELRDRLTIWRQVQSPGGTAYRDAFYVYLGEKMTEGELYRAMVDPRANKALAQRWASLGAVPHETFVTRATEVALSRVGQRVDNLVSQGLLSKAAANKLKATDPSFAKSVMDAIATGGSGKPGQLLPLQDLLEAFEFAAIGSTAVEAGLELPTRDRLMEIRRAGVERSRAIEAYRSFGRDQAQIAAAVQRARGAAFGQREFEQAEFLGGQREALDLEGGLSYMRGAGREQGAFRFDDRSGRITQRGLRTY